MSTPDQIAIRNDLKLGTLSWLAGDRFDIESLKQSGLLSDVLTHDLKVQGYYGDLTKESFAHACGRRPFGSPPPTGFTEAYLVELGIIEPGELPKQEKKAWAKPVPPAPKPKAEKPAKPAKITKVTFGPDMIVHGDYRIQPRKAGNWTFFDAADQEGNLLRDAGFRSIDAAKVYLDTLTAASTAARAAATSGPAPEEPGDARDIRSSAEG